MGIQSFKVEVPQGTLDDLRARLGLRDKFRLPQRIVRLPGENFDRRAQEEKLNSFDHFRAGIDGFGLHFIHEKGKGANSILPSKLIVVSDKIQAIKFIDKNCKKRGKFNE